MSFSVAVLGKQRDAVIQQYGIQVFYDLSVDQIFSLLENPDPEEGINHAQLGATPTVECQVMGGGLFYPSAVRKETAQAMQGVDIMVTVATVCPWYHDHLAKQFFQWLIGDNLLDECEAVIVQIVPWKNESDYSGDFKPQTVDDILKTCSFNTPSLKDKLYVLADKEVSWGKYQPKLDGDIAAATALLRSQLLAKHTTEVGTVQ